MIPPVRRRLPSGTVTFLFTDVEGSTRLLRALGADDYAEAVAEHRRVIREACAHEGGVEVDTQGDAFFFAFPTAPGAVAAASAFTRGLALGELRVRVGLHTGTPLLTAEGYVGDDVHRAARIAASGHGGQVLVSSSTARLVEVELLDLGEHRLKDLSAPERIFQLGDGDFPALRSLYRTNLPVPATSFLGREQELAEVVELLSDDGARLLTLTGPGGTGKTRLALQAAGIVSDAYPEGVWWIPLAPLRDPDLVLATAAQILGSKNGLAEHISDKAMLCLFDNFEQVVEAAPELGALVSACPNLDILVTSRERLRVRGEQTYPVPQLAASDGEALFLTRARAVDPAFAPSEAVRELCLRLDELPLAIELAAARTAIFSPEQLLGKLSQRLDLLKGERDADPRQLTLRATIEWSYDLLSEEEQRLYCRLAVFSGGCTYEAAEEIAAADPDILQSLLDKSLVRRRVGTTGEPRYWMLSTIEAFAAEKLGRAQDIEQLRDAHARWYAIHAASIAMEVRMYDQRAVAASVDELDNVRTGIARAVESRDAELLGLYLFGIWFAWMMHGNNREARNAVERWLELDREPIDPTVRLGGLVGAGEILRLSDYGRARALKLEAIDIARAYPDASLYGWPLGSTVAATLADIVDIDIAEGDLEAARAHAEDALALRVADGAALGIAHAKVALAAVSIARGELTGARELLLEAASVHRSAGRDGEAARGLLGVASLEIELGLIDSVRRRLGALLAELPRLGDISQVIYAAAIVAALAARDGDPRTAALLLGAADHRARDAGAEPFVPPAERAIWEGRRAAVEAALTADELSRAQRAGAALDDAATYHAMQQVVGPEARVESLDD